MTSFGNTAAQSIVALVSVCWTFSFTLVARLMRDLRKCRLRAAAMDKYSWYDLLVGWGRAGIEWKWCGEACMAMFSGCCGEGSAEENVQVH